MSENKSNMCVRDHIEKQNKFWLLKHNFLSDYDI